MRMLKHYRTLVLALLLFAMGESGALAANNPGSNGYRAYSIMSQFLQRHGDLVMVAAHRGLHAAWGHVGGPYGDAPENSLQSIQQAADNGIEIIELDVRLTQNGVPILTHDSTWGRETNVGNNWGACCFNPWGPLPGLTVPDGDPGELGGGDNWVPGDSQAAVNPNVKDWSYRSVCCDSGGIRLRNSTTFDWSPWNETPPTLNDALHYMANNRLAMVIMLDIKDNNALQVAWQFVAHAQDYNGNGYAGTTIFKFDAAWNYPWPQNFQNAFSGHTISQAYPDWLFMNIMPVFQTSGIAPNLYGWEPNELAAMQAYESQSYTRGVEVNLKQNPGILSSLYNWADGYAGNTTKALANFMPYREWVDPADPNQTPRFFYSNGYCCAMLSEYYYNGAPHNQPSDTDDQRGNIYFTLANPHGFNLVTTDDPLSIGYYLWQRGQRNMSYFY